MKETLITRINDVAIAATSNEQLRLMVESASCHPEDDN